MKPTHTIILLLFLTIELNAQTTPEFERIHININSKKIGFNEIIRQVEVIALEETDQTLLSHVEFYLPIDKGFILGSKGDKKFYFFDESGNYSFHIENEEQGDKGFSGFSSAWLSDNHLEFFSPTDRKLYRYDLNGNYIESSKVKIDKNIRLGEMNPFNNGYAVTTIENLSIDDGEILPSPAGHAIIYLDSELKTIGHGHKDNTLPPFPIANVPRLYRDKDLVLYKEILNDTIFSLTKNGVFPYIKLDFGEDWAWNHPKNSEYLGTAFATINRGNFVYDLHPFFSQEYIFIKEIINSDTHLFGIILRKTKEFLNIRDNIKETGFWPLSVENDQLIVLLQSYSVEDFLKNLDSTKISIKGSKSGSNLLSSENPVLLKIKFK